MLRPVLNLPKYSIFWTTVGSLSCVAGLLFYALSSSFKSLFKEWNTTKIILYTIICYIISVVLSDVSKLKPHVEFLVLMLTSLYSFLTDRSKKEKPATLNAVSSGAFTMTSLCLSRQNKAGFGVGLFSFFLGCVTVQLMKIHLIFILVAAGFCYPLVVLGSYSESKSENGDSSGEESIEIRVDDDDENRASVRMGQDNAGQISPRRRLRNISSNRLTQDDDRRGSVSNMSIQSHSSNNHPPLARRCANCHTTSTPLWRNGPRGPKSVCNACGIRYKKEERRAATAPPPPLPSQWLLRWVKKTKDS